MHIAPTGFPGHLSGYRFFPSLTGVFRPFEDERFEPCLSVR
jgi:hypothetical protein